MLARVRHPRLRARAVHHRARWIIRRAKVNHIGRGYALSSKLARNIGKETVGFGAGEIGDSLISAARQRRAGVADHDIRVDIDGIDRVGHGDAISRAEDFKNRSAITFRAVGKKDLVVGDIYPALAKIAMGDCAAHRLVTRAWAVASKRRARGQFRSPGIDSLG